MQPITTIEPHPSETLAVPLHAVTIRDTVSFHLAHRQFDGDGRPRDPETVARAAATLLDQLTWWGRALRDARVAHPYGA